jgi:hypothetical protein
MSKLQDLVARISRKEFKTAGSISGETLEKLKREYKSPWQKFRDMARPSNWVNQAVEDVIDQNGKPAIVFSSLNLGDAIGKVNSADGLANLKKILGDHNKKTWIGVRQASQDERAWFFAVTQKQNGFVDIRKAEPLKQ